jgi:rhamnogalacturonyl hydrolase YesR
LVLLIFIRNYDPNSYIPLLPIQLPKQVKFMKKVKTLFTCQLVLFLFFLVNISYAQDNRIFNKEYITDIIDKVNTYQLNNPWTKEDFNWIRGTYYTGVMACYQAAGIEKYLLQCNAWGNSYNWGIPPIGYAEGSGANVLTCSQTWLECYMAEKEKYKILPVIEHLEKKDLKTPVSMPGSYYYEAGRKYVDALYVCAPALAMLSKVTGDPKYLAWMDAFFWDVYGTLYDDKDHLFYRDIRFRPEFDGKRQEPVIPDSINYADAREPYAYQKTKNGKKVFWARGNGWAFASLTRILKYIPADYGNYNRYKELFIEMAEQLKMRQQPDGFWYPNLDDPFDYGSKESSGTGFFTYGLAWGINNGILAEEEYMPVVEKAWEGLVSVVSTEGKVQWGQSVSFGPHKILMEDSHEYVAGMFLLAASEIYKLKR